MKTINELSSFDYPVRFYDEEDQPFSPTTVHWRVYCETTDTVVQDWTAATSVAETDEVGNVTAYRADITVTGPMNALQKPNNAKELRHLLVVSNKDEDDELSQDFPYTVRKVPGRS